MQLPFKTILITGGAGFIGSSIAIMLRNDYEGIRVLAFDNLKRRGAEYNINRVQEYGVEFIHGDVRNYEDLDGCNGVDLILECSAEPSVLAGVGSSPRYVLNTNLLGTLNCLEFARINASAIIFLSTSRVYSMRSLNAIPYIELPTRYDYDLKCGITGVELNRSAVVNPARSVLPSSQ